MEERSVTDLLGLPLFLLVCSTSSTADIGLTRLGSVAIAGATSVRVDCVTSAGTSLENVGSLISVEANSVIFDLVIVGSAIIGSAIVGSAIVGSAMVGLAIDGLAIVGSAIIASEIAGSTIV